MPLHQCNALELSELAVNIRRFDQQQIEICSRERDNIAECVKELRNTASSIQVGSLHLLVHIHSPVSWYLTDVVIMQVVIVCVISVYMSMHLIQSYPPIFYHTIVLIYPCTLCTSGLVPIIKLHPSSHTLPTIGLHHCLAAIYTKRVKSTRDARIAKTGSVSRDRKCKGFLLFATMTVITAVPTNNDTDTFFFCVIPNRKIHRFRCNLSHFHFVSSISMESRLEHVSC